MGGGFTVAMLCVSDRAGVGENNTKVEREVGDCCRRKKGDSLRYYDINKLKW